MRKLDSNLFKKEYFILLLPVYFVIHGFTINYPNVPKTDALIVLFRYIVITIIVVSILFLVFKNWRKSSVFAFWVLLIQMFFGPFHDFSKQLFENAFVTKYIILIPLLTLFIITLFYWIKRTKLQFKKLVLYLNTLLLLLIIIDLVTIFFFTNHNSIDSTTSSNSITTCNECPKPDIYFIVADEYAGNKELKELLQFDNAAFEKTLIDRGFSFVKNSRSNYNYTPFSIASILGMDYINGITRQSNNIENRKISYERINKNELTNILKAHGYTFYNYSAFDFYDQPTLIDNEFFLTREKLITGQTLTQRLNRNVRFNLVTKFKIKSEIKNLANLTHHNNELLLKKTFDIVNKRIKAPKFVFTHLFLPHYPYLFDKNGKPNPIEVIRGGNQHRQKEYIEYLQYANSKLLKLIDHIKANSSHPPIIILMGDHGFRHFSKPVDPSYHFLNLNAVYLPKKNDSLFHEGMSGVNQFRVILNSTFNQTLPLLKDSTSFLEEY